jgi:hypothetical protein
MANGPREDFARRPGRAGEAAERRPNDLRQGDEPTKGGLEPGGRTVDPRRIGVPAPSIRAEAGPAIPARTSRGPGGRPGTEDHAGLGPPAGPTREGPRPRRGAGPGRPPFAPAGQTAVRACRAGGRDGMIVSTESRGIVGEGAVDRPSRRDG